MDILKKLQIILEKIEEKMNLEYIIEIDPKKINNIKNLLNKSKINNYIINNNEITFKTDWEFGNALKLFKKNNIEIKNTYSWCD